MNNFNLYADFEKKLLNLPLWVKEIIYLIMKKNLKELLPCSDLDVREEDLYQYLCPTITYAGRKEAERLSKEAPSTDEYKFLAALLEGKSIIEITLNNAWTLEETSQIYCKCIKNQFVAMAENPLVNAKAAYFANQIRIGEYFKRIGLIDVDQLEEAMKIQKESELSNEKKGFASILINLNLVTRNDTDNVLLIKQESKRRFTLNFNSNQNNSNPDETIPDEIQEKIERLEYENKLLKTKLKKILNIK